MSTKLKRPPFSPFDERKAVVIYRRNLPHWRQEGATYFITFRLADSLPKPLLEQWDDEKRCWLAARGLDYQPKSADWHRKFETQLSSEQKLAFRQEFNRKLNHELDRGLGACIFREDPCLRILRDTLLERDGDDYHLGDFIIMPNHVHLFINLASGTELDKPTQRIKGGSAFRSNQALGRSGKLWQRESYDHLVRDIVELQAFRKYVRENPLKARIRLGDGAYYEAEWMNEWFAE